jgi:hypothetical protein
LNAELHQTEADSRQATDDLRDVAAATQEAAERAFETRMRAATIKAEKKSTAAHAKLDDDQSVAKIARLTKVLDALRAEESRARNASETADAFHAEKEEAAKLASLNAVNVKTAAKAAEAVGQETTAMGQARASRVAELSAASKRAEANLLQAAYAQSEASARFAAAQRRVAEGEEALADELALEKLLAAKSRKAEQDFIDSSAKHAALETQTNAEGRKAETALFASAVADADAAATLEKAKRSSDRAQEIAAFKLDAETEATETARDLEEKHELAAAAYEQAKAAVAIQEKKFTQSEDRAFEEMKPEGESDAAATILPDQVIGTFEHEYERRTTAHADEELVLPEV